MGLNFGNLIVANTLVASNKQSENEKKINSFSEVKKLSFGNLIINDTTKQQEKQVKTVSFLDLRKISEPVAEQPKIEEKVVPPVRAPKIEQQKLEEVS